MALHEHPILPSTTSVVLLAYIYYYQASLLRLARLSILSPYTIAICIHSCFLHGILVRQQFHLNKVCALRPAEIRAMHVSTAKFVQFIRPTQWDMMSDALFRQDLLYVKQPNGGHATPTPTPREAPNMGEQVLWIHGMCQSGRQLGGIDHLAQGSQQGCCQTQRYVMYITTRVLIYKARRLVRFPQLRQ